MARSDERGIALVMALLVMLLVSGIAASMIAVARSETLSSTSYRSMSQVRYGAESGVHAAANHLLFTYVSPETNPADPLASYDMTVSPVTFGGNPVVLSSDPDVPSNYPVAAVRDAFTAASQGTLNADGWQVAYAARATLISMRQLTDPFTGVPTTLQTWEIAGVGTLNSVNASAAEVVATLERQPVPVFNYAAFATFSGCSALSFAGGATVKSYDSGAALVGGEPVIANTDGNVGTNGNLDGNGDPTTIHGTLSTPRAGVGNCTTNNVTAATTSGWATIEEGLAPLPQPVNFATPPAPSPAPPTSNISFGKSGCPAGAPYCAGSSDGSTITPPSPTSIVSLGNVNMNGGAVVHLNAGIYHVNSLTLAGNARIVIDSGPVIFKIAGEGQTTPLDLAGGGVSNPSFDPTKLQFIYGGTGNIKVTGGTDTAALVYAPNASAALSGTSTHFYGSMITNQVTATGGFNLYYDRRLARSMMTAGNPTMSSFTWRAF